jgi:hypothetical protein
MSLVRCISRSPLIRFHRQTGGHLTSQSRQAPRRKPRAVVLAMFPRRGQVACFIPSDALSPSSPNEHRFPFHTHRLQLRPRRARLCPPGRRRFNASPGRTSRTISRRPRLRRPVRTALEPRHNQQRQQRRRRRKWRRTDRRSGQSHHECPQGVTC